MKFKISYYVWGKKFSAVADTIAEAYEYVEAIIRTNEIRFPNIPEALSKYMIVLVNMYNGQSKFRYNQTINIERVDDPDKGATNETD